MYDDTIVAIATPLGQAALGIVRLSGAQSLPIASRLFDRPLPDRRLVYGYLRDPATGYVIDEVQVVYCGAPHTYTAEDTVEINCHGGAIVVQSVLGLLLSQGARLANPGEFTLRAFLNGRIDLAQAEAVLDVIEAQTEAGLRAAVQGLAGRFSLPLKELRSKLLEILAGITADIDFPEDEVDTQDTLGSIRDARERLIALLATADIGMAYRHGVRTAIVGSPNVGKSSLLNALLRENRAIVTPLPGTTRDTLEEVLNLQGVPFVLVDTAGIAESDDLVEQMGVERSRQAVERADLVLFVLDGSQPLSGRDRQIAELLERKTVLAIANKSDVARRLRRGELPWPLIAVSAITRDGLPELERQMRRAVFQGEALAPDAPLVTNPRHKDALLRAERRLAAAETGVASGSPTELVAVDLTAAIGALGEITGQTVTEDLLEMIFSRFCIGK